MLKKIFLSILAVIFFISPALAEGSLVIEQVESGNIKVINKTPGELKNDGDVVLDKEKVSNDTQLPNMAVRERERANIIINQQNYVQNKDNINNNSVKKNDKNTRELLKQEHKDAEKGSIHKAKGKTNPVKTDKKSIEESDDL